MVYKEEMINEDGIYFTIEGGVSNEDVEKLSPHDTSLCHFKVSLTTLKMYLTGLNHCIGRETSNYGDNITLITIKEPTELMKWIETIQLLDQITKFDHDESEEVLL